MNHLVLECPQGESWTLFMISLNYMKIQVINENEDIIRVYHSPKEVIIRPKSKVVQIIDENDHVTETFNLIEKSLDWIDNPNADCTEIGVMVKIQNDPENISS